jgi:hypothetical protein
MTRVSERTWNHLKITWMNPSKNSKPLLRNRRIRKPTQPPKSLAQKPKRKPLEESSRTLHTMQAKWLSL